MNLHELITKDLLLPNMAARDKEAAIHEMCEFVRNQKKFSAEITRKIETAVLEREERGSTGIGKGVAIPHTKKCAYVDEPIGALGVSRDGIPFDAIDREPVKLVFLIVSPESGGEEAHLQIMRKIAHIGRDNKTNQFLMTTTDYSTLGDILKEVDDYFSRN